MPVGMQHDFSVGGNGYMLAVRPNAWARTGQADSPSRRSPEDTKYGTLPDEIDHPEVWNDWSGGYGDAYRQADRLNTYHWAENFDARWPGQLVHAQKPLLAAVVASFAAANLSLGSCINHFLDLPWQTVKISGVSDTITLGKGAAAGWTPTDATGGLIGGFLSLDPQTYGNRPALFGSYLILPILDGSVYRATQLSDSAIYNAHEDYPHNGRAFTTAGSRLWKVFGNGHRGLYLQSCGAGADPTATTSWGATFNIGDGVADIVDIVALGDQVFAGGAGGVYAGDTSGTFYNLLADIGIQRHVDNCRDLAVYGGRVIAQTGAGIYAIQPAQNSVNRAIVDEIGPPTLGNRSPVGGFPRALRPFGPWLYAGYWTGSQSYILAGIDASPGLPFVWHTMQRLPNVAKVGRIHVDSATLSSGGLRPVPNRMWVATDASIATGGTAPLYLWPIPAQNGNPLNPDATFIANYNGSARIDMPATNWQAPATPKVFRAVEVWAENLASGAQYGDIYYTIDGGTRTLLGRAQQSPVTILYFPTEAGGSFATGQSIALSLESFTASWNVSPIYRSIVLRGALRPKAAEVITAQITLADNTQDRNSTPMRPAATQLAELRGSADGVTPRVLIDISGAANWVAVLQPVEEAVVFQQGTKNPELIAIVRLAVLKFSGG